MLIHGLSDKFRREYTISCTNKFLFITGCFAVFFFSELNFSFAKPRNSITYGNYTFYGLGGVDNIDSALRKLRLVDCQCVTGKATSLEISNLPLGKAFAKVPRTIKEILAMDRDLQHWGLKENVKTMSINVLHCIPKADGVFGYWNLYFSSFTGRLLSIFIKVGDYELMKGDLISKHGDCVKNEYCEENGNALLLKKFSDHWNLIFFYTENIRSHHTKVRQLIQKKRGQRKKSLKGAF